MSKINQTENTLGFFSPKMKKTKYKSVIVKIHNTDIPLT